ncbi:MAG: hypothetical protein DBY42_03125 [Bacillota bacterium]|nr:MAG: hypothetical protein DBY42_03125 [Bacillota bacterium]
MRSDAQYCDICLAELKSLKKKTAVVEEPTVEICPECNENPVVPGQELCKLCLLEKKRLELAERRKEKAADEDAAMEDDVLDDELMEEEIPVPDDDLPLDEEMEEELEFDEDEDEEFEDEEFDDGYGEDEFGEEELD